ncbi:hypothetical protein B5M09_004897 [Aphanomyces astaci]|uniref:Phospholipase B-like n=1 Tax=Aphanomyces astaci TaxID=112090 RepID=A0A3R7YTI3_APHAT|nr:hypothetical protein B5M09_004897 [Aphanomyces astaci]
MSRRCAMEAMPLLRKAPPTEQDKTQQELALNPHRPLRSWLHGVVAVVSLLLVLVGLTSISSSITPPVSSNLSPPPSTPLNVRTVWVVVNRTVDGQLVAAATFDVAADTIDGSTSHAYATFNDSVPRIGWSQLWLRATPASSNSSDAFNQAMYAAGYAEGALTHRRIHEHYWNTRSYFFGRVPTAINLASAARVYDFLDRNVRWLRSQVATMDTNDTLHWAMVGGVLAQLEGLVQGYNDHRGVEDSSLSELDLLFLNADGDMPNLIARTMPPAADAATVTSLTKPSTSNFKCSALIRILDDDLLWGHATWDTYTALNKMFKHYDLPLPSHSMASRAGQERHNSHRRRISMSSSPGYLSSVDDWYLLDSGLGVMETTNGNYNATLAAMISPESCLSWVRTKVANALAVDGPSWTVYFGAYNSGTYNNQWMVLDTSRFSNGALLPHGLTLLEQLPGEIMVQDVSNVVNTQGYWASYNIPYFEHIYNKSGFAAKAAASTANNYQHDELSLGDPGRAIAARYDLASNPLEFALNGAIDAKVTSVHLARQLQCEAVLGPSNDNQPTFEWTAAFDKLALHKGHPTAFNFSFIAMRHHDHLEHQYQPSTDSL